MNLTRLRDFTPARVGLGRVGASLPTNDLLEFQLAHARARDAVQAKLDVSALLLELKKRRLAGIAVASAAADRTSYLRRPDLGRRLNDESRRRLKAEPPAERDVVFVIADGLSALAVERHALSLLDAAIARIQEPSPIAIVVAEQGRVAIGDDIGQILGARLSVVLIGERPGLSSPDSLGVYLTWNPQPARTDAERNCISNIRGEGLSYARAADTLIFLMTEARRRKLSGVVLKEAGEPPLLA